MNKKIFKFFLVFFLIFQTESFATNPSDFVQSAVNRASEILKQNISKEEKMEKIELIAEEVVDIKGIAYYTLGSYRKELNDEQMQQYLTLFEKYFLKTFTSRLTDYSEPKIDVVSAEVKNPKYTIVKSVLLATDKKPAVNIEWRVYTKNPDKPLIRDLIIEGLSLARAEKEQFDSVIQSNNGNVIKLFDVLKEFVAKQ